HRRSRCTAVSAVHLLDLWLRVLNQSSDSSNADQRGYFRECDCYPLEFALGYIDYVAVFEFEFNFLRLQNVCVIDGLNASRKLMDDLNLRIPTCPIGENTSRFRKKLHKCRIILEIA